MPAITNVRLIIASVFLLLINHSVLSATTDYLTHQQPFIEVKGQNEKDVSPDYVAIELVVNVTAKDAETAKLNNDRAVKNIFKIAQEFNIPKVDQQADKIQRYPSYEWKINKRKYRGETIRRTITLKARDFNRYSQLIDQLSSAQNVSINSTQARLNNLERVQIENLRQALKNARSKAQAMLSTYGQKIDQAIMINEGNTRDNQIRPYMMMRSNLNESDNSETPAEFIFEPIKVKSEVRVRFSIR